MAAIVVPLLIAIVVIIVVVVCLMKKKKRVNRGGRDMLIVDALFGCSFILCVLQLVNEQSAP